jgi:hypothetical protein
VDKKAARLRLGCCVRFLGCRRRQKQEFDAPPPADTQLLIHLATIGSIQLVPFKIENIPLP